MEVYNEHLRQSSDYFVRKVSITLQRGTMMNTSHVLVRGVQFVIASLPLEHPIRMPSCRKKYLLLCFDFYLAAIKHGSDRLVLEHFRKPIPFILLYIVV